MVAACYSGNSRAYLASWALVTDGLSHQPPFSYYFPYARPFSWGGTGSFAEWKEFPSPQTFLRRADFVFDERIIDRLPTVGGRPYAVHEPGENRITGVLIMPPKGDPRVSTRIRRDEMNANPDHLAPARRVAFVDSAYVRPRRGRSSSRPRA